MTYTWTIKREGELYRISRNDGLEVTPAPRSKLRQALEPHGILGDLYDEVCRQLDATGEATASPALMRGGIRQL
jgi:hypothetical protein